MTEDMYTIQIRKRPWWMWLLAVVWLLVEIFFLQTAIASLWEYESRAATISWVIFFILFVVGVAIWLRQGQPKSTKITE